MNCSMLGLHVHHQLLEFTQTHVQWVGDAIQPSHPLSFSFSSLLQFFPESGSFQMSQLFASGNQGIRVSASTSVLPMNPQEDWFPFWWTDWIFLQSKGPSRVFSNTTAQKQQFFDAQPSLSFLRNSQLPQLTTACLSCIIFQSIHLMMRILSKSSEKLNKKNT